MKQVNLDLKLPPIEPVITTRPGKNGGEPSFDQHLERARAPQCAGDPPPPPRDEARPKADHTEQSKPPERSDEKAASVADSPSDQRDEHEPTGADDTQGEVASQGAPVQPVAPPKPAKAEDAKQAKALAAKKAVDALNKKAAPAAAKPGGKTDSSKPAVPETDKGAAIDVAAKTVDAEAQKLADAALPKTRKAVAGPKSWNAPKTAKRAVTDVTVIEQLPHPEDQPTDGAEAKPDTKAEVTGKSQDGKESAAEFKQTRALGGLEVKAQQESAAGPTPAEQQAITDAVVKLQQAQADDAAPEKSGEIVKRIDAAPNDVRPQSSTATANAAAPNAPPRGLAEQATARAPRDGQTTNTSEADRVRFVQRVARAFQTAGERGGPLRLRLSPPELGSLRLEVSVRGGAMTARLEAETPAARTMLLDNLPELRQRLAEHDITVEQFDVELMGQSPDNPRDKSADPQDRQAQPPIGSPRLRTKPTEAATAGPAPSARRPGSGQLNVVI